MPFFNACQLTGLFQVGADDLRQFKHRHLVLAEQGAQLGVRVDVALVCGILKIMLLDVFPDLFGDLGARNRSGTDDSGKRHHKATEQKMTNAPNKPTPLSLWADETGIDQKNCQNSTVSH